MGVFIYLKNGDGKIEIKDRKDLKVFLSGDEVRNKNVLLKISATWCNPCKVLNDNLYDIIQEINNHSDSVSNNIKSLREKKETIIIDIDTDEYPDISSFMRVRSLPTMASYFNGEIRNMLNSPKNSELLYFMSTLE